jgi:hypothetical protein
MMDAVRTSETSVYSNENTRRYIGEDSLIFIKKKHRPSHRCDDNIKIYPEDIGYGNID